MVIDSSAIVAVIRAEPDARTYTDALSAPGPHWISAGTYVEVGIVIDAACNPVASRKLDDFFADFGIRLSAVTPEQAAIARAAHRDYGRGSGHPAKLNFGDCFAYALAKDRREPLLFKGDDFGHTDVTPAL